MEKFIQVYDNLLPDPLVNKIEHYILYSQELPFYYNPSITSPDTNSSYPGFINTFFDKNIINDCYFNFSQILYKFCDKLNINLLKVNLGRIFLQIPSKVDVPFEPHIDQYYPHWVCLYYVNDSNGDTIFYDNNKEIKRISPKKGRIIFFDGSVYHTAGKPNKNHRAVVNFCFQGKFGSKK